MRYNPHQGFLLFDHADGSNVRRGSILPVQSTLLCFAAFFLRSFETWAVNSGYYREVGLFFPEAREIATFFAVLFYLLLALLAQRRPGAFNIRVIASTCLACSFFGCLILELALQTQSSFETLLAMVVRLLANGLVTVLLGAALCSLRNATAAVVVVAGSSALSFLVRVFLPDLDGQTGAIVTFGILIAATCLSYLPAKDCLDTISKGDAPIDLELSNPNSFISWRSGLYVGLLLFSAILGISLTFSGEGDGFASNLLSAVFGLAITVWFARAKTKSKEDSLFSLAAVSAVAGLAFMPVDSFWGNLATQAMPSMAVSIFIVLIWFLIFLVGSRSIYAMLPTLCVLWAIQSFGVLLGAVMGHRLNAESIAVSEFSAVALVVLFAWLWIGFRKFSFHNAVESLTVLASEEPLEVEQGASGASIEKTCEELGSRYGLTKREIEIFDLLAHGRNGRYIQEKYVISRNTAKTHIRNIYAKLDVHSHQELIDFVENRGKSKA